MDILVNIVLPSIGFILAVIGAWDKLVTFVQLYNKKKAEIIIKNAENTLAKIEHYNSNPSYLIAYLSRNIFLLITFVFFLQILNFTFLNTINGAERTTVLVGVFAWLAGFISGDTMRVTKLVLKAKIVKEKLNATIKRYQMQL